MGFFTPEGVPGPLNRQTSKGRFGRKLRTPLGYVELPEAFANLSELPSQIPQSFQGPKREVCELTSQWIDSQLRGGVWEASRGGTLGLHDNSSSSHYRSLQVLCRWTELLCNCCCNLVIVVVISGIEDMVALLIEGRTMCLAEYLEQWSASEVRGMAK